TRIQKGRGVCGSAWAQAQTLVVPDVDAFAGHIACSSLARSEIVLPLINSDGVVLAVLDVDSAELATFDDIDAQYLARICEAVARLF
ncbi:MAG: GAF domain-containing protein, partial [Burkholderiales bacterium]|nr:GAF domain-containing protein [Burkholderiales bacterium]